MNKFIDITGQRFNELTALKFMERKNCQTFWEFQCKCGNIVIKSLSNVKNGHSKSCGCAIHINIVGQKFNRLIVIEMLIRNNRTYCKCLCVCGNEKIVLGDNLRRNLTNSCGCITKEHTIIRNFRHGKRYTRLYNIWCDMKSRCNNDNNANYGGRGIGIEESSWNNDFVVFEKWAKENGYTKGLTIERIDNNKGYSPENCRWATAKEQANNKRNNHYITYNGETKTLAQWAEILGINRGTLTDRILKSKWDTEKPFSRL